MGDQQRRPSYAELAALVESQAGVIAELESRVGRLEAENAELRRRLGQNSRNSSKPPASEGYEKPAPASLRKRSGRRPGKQPGSEGTALSRVADPDETVEHRPVRCSGCGTGLGDAPVAGVARRQVFDLPPIRLRVREHQLVSCRCACGRVSTGAAPARAAAPVQYGPNLKALAAYLLVYQHVPVARTAGMLADVCGARVSTGWVAQVLSGCSAALDDFEDSVRAAAAAAPVAHFDETGARVAGRLRWLHTACTGRLTCYLLHDKRGVEAMRTFGVLERFTGVAVHDGWGPYATYTHLSHARCGAHHLRELVAASESSADNQHWTQAAIDALEDLGTAAHQARDQGRDRIEEAVLAPLLDRWDQAIKVGLATNRPPPEGVKKRSRTRNLLERLAGNRAEVLAFAFDLAVPFTNNQAERDLRMIKAQLKISGCWRTHAGAAAWLRVRSYISTVRKNDINPLQALRDAFTGNPWMPAIPTPE